MAGRAYDYRHYSLIQQHLSKTAEEQADVLDGSQMNVECSWLMVRSRCLMVTFGNENIAEYCARGIWRRKFGEM
jgi:hypothetical protein